MDHPDPRHVARLATYGSVSTHLSLLSDHRLGEVVAAATPLGSGIGGRSAELEVGGTRVFVKRVPLTDIEMRPENLRSTANHFGLPMFYQYGAGSAGFGAWRELAVHTMTTNWVLGNEYDGFPLMYHWRVLPDSPPQGFADDFGGIDGAVAHWEGSAAVRGRLEALGRSSFSLVLFLEHVPFTLAMWLGEQRKAPPEGEGGLAHAWAEEVLTGAAFMSSRGLVHFDAHFDNVLTDGRFLYFADFGLALSSGFELSREEGEFLTAHLTYDSCYVANHMLRHHLPDGVRGKVEHEVFLRNWIAGERSEGAPPAIAAIIDRHARSAVVLDGFHRRLLAVSKRTSYPAADIERARPGGRSARWRRAGSAGIHGPGRPDAGDEGALAALRCTEPSEPLR
ncbi:protein kinase family protein [Streptomyces sp. NPDC096354]|uniref:protein kinase family protein n=1 Tax=Streptomyces sp. NPDC096354 TaxID=3366088 RepID=UPI00381CB61D